VGIFLYCKNLLRGIALLTCQKGSERQVNDPDYYLNKSIKFKFGNFFRNLGLVAFPVLKTILKR